jgi:hypothetical protein
MGLSAGLNTYTYVAGHPLSSLDDFGLRECSNLTCFPGFTHRRLISSNKGTPSSWSLENVHIEPVNVPRIPPTRLGGLLPLDINLGQEHGSCYFGRYRDISETVGIYRQYACLQVCTGDCGKPYSRWNIQEQFVDSETKYRRDREQFVVNLSGAIVALKCRLFLDGMR